MTDCIIIGGGIVGLLTARELRAGGMDVLVVERRATGQESSWAGGGILSPLYPWRYPEPVTALAAWSQRHYRATCEELAGHTGIDPEWIESGLLILETGEQPAAEAWAHSHDTPLQRLTGTAITAIEPALGLAPPGALWLPRVAQVRNPRLLKALRADLLARGVRLREQSEVTALLEREHKIVGVSTQGETLPAPRMVVAGGAWSGQLLASLGISLPVAPVRGQMLLFQGTPGLIRHMVMHEGHYLIPRRDGQVLAGSTVEHAGFDRSTTSAAYHELWDAAVAMVPGLAKCPVMRHWAGLRPGSPHGVPFIGAHPTISGLFVNTGHFRNGVVLGLASARLLADLILERPPILFPEPYALEAGPRYPA